MLYYDKTHSILGPIYIVEEEGTITGIKIGEEEWNAFKLENKIVQFTSPLLKEAVKQFTEYFAGERKAFDLPLLQTGTHFQKKVWGVLSNIPYGKTASYLDVATAINNPKAVRAVGQANKRNSLPIIIPCHRVIGKNNELTGYAGNKISLKEKLLLLEGAL